MYDEDLIPYALESENVIPDVIPNSQSIIYSWEAGSTCSRNLEIGPNKIIWENWFFKHSSNKYLIWVTAANINALLLFKYVQPKMLQNFDKRCPNWATTRILQRVLNNLKNIHLFEIAETSVLRKAEKNAKQSTKRCNIQLKLPSLIFTYLKMDKIRYKNRPEKLGQGQNFATCAKQSICTMQSKLSSSIVFHYIFLQYTQTAFALKNFYHT